MNSVQLWIKALRSGKYKKTIGALQLNNEYCCLGVACDLYQQYVGGLEVKSIKTDDEHAVTIFYFNGNDSVLPPKVQKWLGLNSKDGAYENEKYKEPEEDEYDASSWGEASEIRLTELNDGEYVLHVFDVHR